jgi:putative DNA primase/helicase
MQKIDFDKINSVALASLENLLRHLFPSGKKIGREFKIGDIYGSEGDSLSINLNTGVWCDFASGDKGSDPISLVACVRQCSQGDSAKFLDEFFASGAIQISERKEPKKQTEEWEAMPFAPSDCSEPDTNHYKFGKPNNVWKYCDTENRLVGLICRFDRADGSGKEVIPITWCKSQSGKEGWRWKSFAKPRCLYNSQFFSSDLSVAVLIVEGEKTADSAQRLLPHMFVTTWAGGAKAVELANWKLLQNRKVVIWGDNDDAGVRASVAIQAYLPQARIVQPPERFEGWDLADAEQEGWTTEQVRSYLKASTKEVPEVRILKPIEPKETNDSIPTDEIPSMAEPPQPVVEEEPMPFRILGHDEGQYFYLPNSSQQIVSLTAGEHRQLPLLRLAPANWWESNFPSKNGADWNAVANALMQKAHTVGIFSPKKVRGRGVWIDGEHIVFHAGDSLVINNKTFKIPEFETKFIYEQGQKISVENSEVLKSAEASKLISICENLSWKEPIYAKFLAGWCALAPISGVLQWRPHIWINGASGTGKTWILNNIIDPLVGRVALQVQSATTEAGIRQSLKSDALPVIFDEAESEDLRGRMRMQSILELARQASSEGGAGIIKGSASGKAQEYQIRSCFAFASIGVSASMRADTSRITSLELKKLSGQDADEQFRKLKSAWADSLANKDFAMGIRSRSLHLAKVICHNGKVFGSAVASILGDQRVGDQIGTLLAGAYSLTSSKEVDFDFAKQWVESQNWSGFLVQDEDKDEIRALSTLLDAHIRYEFDNRTITRSVSEILFDAIDAGEEYVDGETKNTARAVLMRHGIKVETDTVAVSNHHQALKKIFNDTPWADKWHNQLSRVHGAIATAGIYLNGSTHRAVRIPIAHFKK